MAVTNDTSKHSTFIVHELSIGKFHVINRTESFSTLGRVATRHGAVLLLTLASLAVSMLTTLLLACRVSAPVLTLTGVVGGINAKSFGISIPICGKRSRITVLCDGFGGVLRVHRELARRICNTGIHRGRTRLHALRTRVGPRFLCGALSSVG